MLISFWVEYTRKHFPKSVPYSIGSMKKCPIVVVNAGVLCTDPLFRAEAHSSTPLWELPSVIGNASMRGAASSHGCLMQEHKGPTPLPQIRTLCRSHPVPELLLALVEDSVAAVWQISFSLWPILLPHLHTDMTPKNMCREIFQVQFFIAVYVFREPNLRQWTNMSGNPIMPTTNP